MTSFADAVVYSGDVLAHDFEIVCSELSLGAPARTRLASNVTGFLPGNRDKPLFDLCRAMARMDRSLADRHDFPYVIFISESGSGLKSLEHRALLMFAFEMDSRKHFERVLELCTDLASGPSRGGPEWEDQISQATRELSRLFYGYRAEHLPFASARDRFIAIQAFMTLRLGREIPEDGDALAFWSEHAGSQQWALFEKAACRFADFRFAVKTALASAAVAVPTSLEQLVAAQAPAMERARQDPWDSARDEDHIMDAIAEVSGSELRILSARDKTNLERLAKLCRFIRDWPRTSIGAIGFGNIQNRVVQALRTGSLGDPSYFLPAGRDEFEFEAAVKLYSAIGLVTKQALRLAYDSRGDSEAKRRSEDMGRTIVLPEADRLLRRASIASRSRREIHVELMKLVPALYSLNTWLDEILEGWARQADKGRDALAEDWATFSDTIMESYGDGGRDGRIAGAGGGRSGEAEDASPMKDELAADEYGDSGCGDPGYGRQ